MKLSEEEGWNKKIISRMKFGERKNPEIDQKNLKYLKKNPQTTRGITFQAQN